MSRNGIGSGEWTRLREKLGAAEQENLKLRAALAKYANRHNWLGLEEVAGQCPAEGDFCYVWMPGGEEENGWREAEEALWVT